MGGKLSFGGTLSWGIAPWLPNSLIYSVSLLRKTINWQIVGQMSRLTGTLGFRRGLRDHEVDHWIRLVNLLAFFWFRNADDKLMWNLEGEKKFSIKSAFYKLIEGDPKAPPPFY